MIFFKHMSFWCPFFDSCPTTYHSNIGVQIIAILELDTYTLVIFVCCHHHNHINKLWYFVNVNCWYERCLIILFSISISKVTTLICQLCLPNAVDDETYFVLVCTFYNSIRDRFIFLFHNVILGCLKCHFQLDHRNETTWCIFHNT